jgi:hypothetical protein
MRKAKRDMSAPVLPANRFARRAAVLSPLAQQDRTPWDRHAISEGIALINGTLSRGSIGPYQVQAAIAAVQDEAQRHEDTDWPQILALYGFAQADLRQPDGDAQSRRRNRHGAWPGHGTPNACNAGR